VRLPVFETGFPATTFLATQRAAYAPERSTLVGSLPLKKPTDVPPAD
jgi:hypothetical protein